MRRRDDRLGVLPGGHQLRSSLLVRHRLCVRRRLRREHESIPGNDRRLTHHDPAGTGAEHLLVTEAEVCEHTAVIRHDRGHKVDR